MTDLFARVLLLKRSVLFAETNTEDLRVVAEELVDEVYLAGERIFDIGEQGDHAYILEHGSVGISLEADPQTREFVATLGPGDLFGEMNLFDNLPRSATAHVLQDSHILSLEKGKLRGLLLSYPELGLGLLRGLSLRLRAMNSRIYGVASAVNGQLPEGVRQA
jgi:CRP/FNR family cyclic AMP-dependent transcriptional regulator